MIIGLLLCRYYLTTKIEGVNKKKKLKTKIKNLKKYKDTNT